MHRTDAGLRGVRRQLLLLYVTRRRIQVRQFFFPTDLYASLVPPILRIIQPLSVTFVRVQGGRPSTTPFRNIDLAHQRHSFIPASDAYGEPLIVDASFVPVDTDVSVVERSFWILHPAFLQNFSPP